MQEVAKDLIKCNKDLTNVIQEQTEVIKQEKEIKKGMTLEKKNLKRRLDRNLKKKVETKEEGESYSKRIKPMGQEIKSLKQKMAKEENEKKMAKERLSSYIKSNKNLREKLVRTEKSHQENLEHLENERAKANEKDTSVINENFVLRDQLRQERQSAEYLESLLDDNAHLPLYDVFRGKFSTQLTECVLNLTNNSVPTRNVSNVIREVAKLCNKTPNRLPSRSSVDDMVHSKVPLAQKQLSTVLLDKVHLPHD